MPAPEQIVFPAVQVLGIEHVDPRTDDLVPFDGPNVVPEEVGPDTPDQRDALELVVGGERPGTPQSRSRHRSLSCAAGPGYSSRRAPTFSVMVSHERRCVRYAAATWSGVVSQRTTAATV